MAVQWQEQQELLGLVKQELHAEPVTAGEELQSEVHLPSEFKDRTVEDTTAASCYKAFTSMAYRSTCS